MLYEVITQNRYNEALKSGVVHANDTRWGIMAFLKGGGNTANYVEGADSYNFV